MSRAPLSALHIELLADAGIDALELTDEHLALYARLRLEAELNQVALVDAWETPRSAREVPVGLAPEGALGALSPQSLRERHAQMAYDRAYLSNPGGRGRLAPGTCRSGRHNLAEVGQTPDRHCRACRREWNRDRMRARRAAARPVRQSSTA